MAEVNRTALVLPGSNAVVNVPDEQLDERLAGGWKKIRGKRQADTGSVPVQQSTSNTSNTSSSSSSASSR